MQCFEIFGLGAYDPPGCAPDSWSSESGAVGTPWILKFDIFLLKFQHKRLFC